VVGLTVLAQVLRVQRMHQPLRGDVVRVLGSDRASRVLLGTALVGLVAVPALALAAATTAWAGWLWLVVWVPFLAAARFAGAVAERDDLP
jgi:sterol desaturase/sphingolipid hydroxylase (fatty acid hydroxylase superfamily)